MTVEGAPVWNLAMLMPDGAVGASAAGGRTEDMTARVQTLVTFVELEWIALDDARAEELLADPTLGRFAHWLRGVRRNRRHRLSEPEERILAQKTVTGAGVRQDSRCVHQELIDCNLDEARDVAAAIPA